MNIFIEKKFSITAPIRIFGTAIHPDMQKIRIIEFFNENMLHFILKVGCYYLKHVTSSQPFDHA
jgi:hypothetical protein